MFITGTIAISINFFFYINECFTIYWSNIAKLEALRFWDNLCNSSTYISIRNKRNTVNRVIQSNQFKVNKLIY